MTTWPNRPTCHDNNPQATSKVFAYNEGGRQWRDPDPDREPYGYDYRTCDYCGSIHPGDLVAFFEAEETGSIELADMKYGSPHKIYVKVPNPQAGREVKSGSNADGTPIIKPGPVWTHAKFYLRHLLDDGIDEKAMMKILKVCNAASPRVRFFLHEGEPAWQVMR